jgi:DNA-binding transcriptional MerR regulator
MKTQKYEITISRTTRDLMGLDEVAMRLRIHPDLVRRFMDFGLLEPTEVIADAIMFDPKAVKRIRVIDRLRCDLGINLAGIAVILELLDRLSEFRLHGGRHGYE